MANEMQGTYRHRGNSFAYRATCEVNLADQSIAIDCSFETQGKQRHLNICVFPFDDDLERHATQIAKSRIEAHIDRMFAA